MRKAHSFPVTLTLEALEASLFRLFYRWQPRSFEEAHRVS
jgi:hypothetical protein